MCPRARSARSRCRAACRTASTRPGSAASASRAAGERGTMILVDAERRREYHRQGWWGDITLWDHFERNLRERPDAEAVVDAPNRAEFAHGTPQRWSWAQLGEQVDRFCVLLTEAGVERDQVIALQMPNSVEQFVVYLTCARL